MPTYRRVIEIHTGEDKNLFRTVRVDSDDDLSDEELTGEWQSIIDNFARRYETQTRFVPPREGQYFDGYSPPIKGENNWDWSGEENEEF
jgi:hypothetical protein